MSNRSAPKSPIACVILAAGLGTRMKSDLPKAMMPLAGQPMVGYVLDIARSLDAERIVTVIGPGMDNLARVVAPAETVIQADRLGTAHALLQTKQALAEFKGIVVVLYGDGPLYRSGTIEGLIETLRDAPEAGLAYLGMTPDDPTGYGRFITDADGYLTHIVEENEALPEQKKIRLCWTGVMAARAETLFGWLEQVRNDNRKGEYYLTDLPAIAACEGAKTIIARSPVEETLGANNRAELALLEQKLQQRMRHEAMISGVTLTAPDTVFFSFDTRLGRDVTVEPHVVFGPGVTVEDGAVIKAFSHLEGAHVGRDAQIGPYARLRPGSVVGVHAKVGNFVEMKNTALGDGSKLNHLSYVGDARIGQDCNIGAGTITCNYDGFGKYKTSIGDRVFVGSNSTLVAPVNLADDAFIGAGSAVTQDVPEGALYLARSRGTIKAGWVEAFRQRFMDKKKQKA